MRDIFYEQLWKVILPQRGNDSQVENHRFNVLDFRCREFLFYGQQRRNEFKKHIINRIIAIEWIHNNLFMETSIILTVKLNKCFNLMEIITHIPPTVHKSLLLSKFSRHIVNFILLLEILGSSIRVTMWHWGMNVFSYGSYYH